MTSQIIPVDPFDCIVFGGTGDLAERKLIPALYQRQRDGQLSEPTRIIGASRSPMSNDDYRKFAESAIKEFVKPSEFDQKQVDQFLARVSYVAVDATSDNGWEELKTEIGNDTNASAPFILLSAHRSSPISQAA